MLWLILILKIIKLSPREVKKLVQGHTARKDGRAGEPTLLHCHNMMSELSDLWCPIQLALPWVHKNCYLLWRFRKHLPQQSHGKRSTDPVLEGKHDHVPRSGELGCFFPTAEHNHKTQILGLSQHTSASWKINISDGKALLFLTPTAKDGALEGPCLLKGKTNWRKLDRKSRANLCSVRSIERHQGGGERNWEPMRALKGRVRCYTAIWLFHCGEWHACSTALALISCTIYLT